MTKSQISQRKATLVGTPGRSEAQGLYDPAHEHDACGVGFIADMTGRKSHKIITDALKILQNLEHRGAVGADPLAGDGAGMLVQIPHDFLKEECAQLGFTLPAPGRYAVGYVFMPQDERLRVLCELTWARIVKEQGLELLGWRSVPVDNSSLSEMVIETEPVHRQAFIGCPLTILDQDDFERRLYVTRKVVSNAIYRAYKGRDIGHYTVSLSSRTLVYKGMFLSDQLGAYYADLRNQRLTSALALVHQRFSTNTFPSWKLAHPYRMVAHNGEINTLSGNRNGMRARQAKMASDIFGDDIKDLHPILTPGASDSACFDNMLELLVRSGRSMPHSMMMMIPEAFGQAYHISADKRSFYEYHASIMEPWDGPAAMLFTDGKILGGMLDRNGLRPGRFVVTTDGIAIVASEAGVVDIAPDKIRRKGRLAPGKMFLVDTIEGRIVTNNEIKSKIARQKPYRRWLTQNRIELRGLFDMPSDAKSDPQEVIKYQRAFGYTREELNGILTPMAVNGQEPIGSMGNDTPLAVLSDQPKLLFNYFKQLFAQVTNPPIDPLREGLVMSLMMFTGKRGNILEELPQHCRQLKLPHPILTNEDVERLRVVKQHDFKVATVSALFDVGTADDGESLRQSIETLIDDAEKAIIDGASVLVISDRGITENKAAIPSLLAVSSVHHGLVERGLRSDAGLIVESAEPREVMHFCLLSGFGANAINPYLAFESLSEMHRNGEFGAEMEPSQVADNYIAAIKKGILKTMSKMG
ncbi:MAG: glutamate synthase subunit alpha, partial [Hyphomicrobiaceae bacterium]|nr:glutamate synthase subunit alpha [Hyphomicrobiaceae bacterium]